MAEREVIATYKRYNKEGGNVWDTIYFKTAAAAVGESNSRWFMKPVNTVNSKSFTQNGGIMLYAKDITIFENEKPATYNYISEGQTITEALKALDKAAKDAKDSIPSGVLTTANYAAVLNQVYQAKDDELDKLTNIAGTGYVMRTTLGYSVATPLMLADDIKATHAFVPKERTVNSKALSSDITLTGDDIKTTANGKNISQDIAAIREMANGRSRSFVIDTPTQSETSCNHLFRVKKTDSQSSVKVAVTGAKPLDDIQNNSINLSTLVVGDVIFTKTAGMKDWWYAGEAVDTTIQDSNAKFYWFYQLDADSITVENTFDGTSQNAISGAGVQEAIKTLDVTAKGGSGKYIQSISETDGKISAVEAPMPTSLPASNTTNAYSSTGTAPVSGTAVNQAISQSIPGKNSANKGVKVAIGGTIKEPTVTVTVTGGSVASGNTNVVDGGTVYSAIDTTMKARATKVFYNLKSQGTPTSGMVAGDICIIEESVVS